LALYASGIFLGAFLLFQVQPLIGKCILPWFGGGPAVWTTCMLFFQVLLLAGYGYAHWLSTRLPRRKQVIIHIALLAAAVATLPILPSARWKPHALADPTGSILLLLAASVGLPYLLLSSTSPLLQAWFTATRPGRSPYWLYALSNAGSLLALLSYPFVVEPGFALKTQGILWSLGFGLFAVVCSFTALRVRAAAVAARGAAAPTSAPPADAAAAADAPTGAEANAATEAATNAAAAAPPGPGARLMWMALAACGSVMLLAVTNQMCSDVAVVPFLWILPLAVYLLSFILCFQSARWYPRALWWVVLFVALGGIELARVVVRVPVTAGFALFGTPNAPSEELAFAHGLWKLLTGSGYLGADLDLSEPVSMLLGGVPWLLSEGVDVSLPGQVFGFTAALFACCMVCHGELVRLKPHPRHLTAFYLLVATGGALGGVFVSLVAPRVFPAFLELHIGLWLVCAFAMAAFWLDRKPHRGWPRRWRTMLYLPAFAGLLAALGITLEKNAEDTLADSLVLTRNFYGVLRVSEYYRGMPEQHYYSLQHGRISHGSQFADDERRRWATSYYGPKSGVGLAIAGLRGDGTKPQRIGVVGLGTGTIAAYARPGDHYRFYDINPAVLRIAQTWFHYLGDSRARGADVQVVLGDARLSLEREPPQHFDVLALDAFTSDAIPVHLLTREAFDIYIHRHLRPGGVLAVHISNRYLDLEPVVLAQADYYGYRAVVVESKSDSEKKIDSATWVLLTKNEAFLASQPIREIIDGQANAAEEGEDPRQPPTARRVTWTDDYSNLFQVLK